MEYVIIFVAAVFVNNIVLSQFLGICPFLGVSQKISTAMGMGAAVTFVMTLSTIITFLLHANHRIHSGNRSPGADGRDHTQKSIAALISGIGRIPAPDYHQLYHLGGSHHGNPEKFRFNAIYGFRHIHCYRLYVGVGRFRRHPRTAGLDQDSPSNAGNTHRFNRGRTAGHGVYGILGNRVIRVSINGKRDGSMKSRPASR